ncbi:MAG: acyltransferase, partial [Bacteroidota bacterium]
MIIAALDKPSPKGRFAALDGLRAFAVSGVLWIHIWTVHGNPRYVVGKLDLASVLALGGNGVDLFFVISGFCMYYFYAGNRQFCYADFGAFIKKRWIRLSPAFYTACLVYIIAKLTHDGSYPFLKSALTCLTYQNALFPAYNPEGILWSLTSEWQFYIIVPFLLIYQNRYGFIKSFTVITICLFAIAIAGVMFLKSGSDILSSQIFFRYFEFMWGILAGRLLLLQPNIKLPYNALWLIGFILITYAGRVLISKPVLMLSTNYYNLFKLLGFTVMGFGLSGIIYLALTSKQRRKNFLG